MSKIKEARERLGLSQQALSDMLGIPKRTIENWEMGIRNPPGWAEKLIVERLTMKSIKLYVNCNYNYDSRRKYYSLEKDEYTTSEEPQEFMIWWNFEVVNSGGGTVVRDNLNGGVYYVGTANKTPFLYPVEYGSQYDKALDDKNAIFLTRAN